jgi:predicted nuclease of predicted toxin-antitoxin system
VRFLVDECAGPSLARWLIEQGHTVFSVYQEACGLNDAAILHKAFAEKWILVTADKDFGMMIHRDQHAHAGVVLLRLGDERAPIKIAVMQHLLERYQAWLPDRYVVVTENHVRFSKP